MTIFAFKFAFVHFLFLTISINYDLSYHFHFCLFLSAYLVQNVDHCQTGPPFLDRTVTF